MKTVVIGASPNPSRYSFIASNMLQDYDHEVIPLGIRKGTVAGLQIITDWPKQIDEVDTVTMYVGAKRQPELYSYILGLKPRRIIFNPGTENVEFSALAAVQGVESVEACTLVMLRTSQY
jgi:uncharacterized protein